MSAQRQVFEQIISYMQQLVVAKERQGKDATFELVNLKSQQAFLAMSKAGERLEMYGETGGEDSYSAARAAGHFQAASDLLHEAAQLLAARGQDPHAEVLKEFGITDTK